VARLIVDTSALIATKRGTARWRDLIATDDDVAMASVTAAELLVGVELADRTRRPARERFVEGLLALIPVEDYDLSAARAHALLLVHCRRSGQPRGAHDLLIAATAVSRDREVLTADPTGFAGLPGVAVRTAI
jgi:tRNA(fMet)-specific endonuclease VapC